MRKCNPTVCVLSEYGMGSHLLLLELLLVGLHRGGGGELIATRGVLGAEGNLAVSNWLSLRVSCYKVIV